MKANEILSVPTISAYHKIMELAPPQHPLVSVIAFKDIKNKLGIKKRSMALGYYSIALKKNFNARMRYGQQDYDFDNGLMTFMAPNQVLSIEYNDTEELQHEGLMLLVHPDFFWNTPLSKTIGKYEFFGYAVNEALHLSEKEEHMIKSLMEQIQQEYQNPIDKYSQYVITTQIELLLVYAERYYHRQFLTRKISSHTLVVQLEDWLSNYFNEEVVKSGLPSVNQIAEDLNVSPNYLSSMLKVVTGRSTQQHIHEKIIDKAKEKLSTTRLTVSEIAYDLGFEHSQSFSKLFKNKTKLSPLAFRQGFN